MIYVGLGALLWYATYRAGIHPTIAGVVLGLLTPATPFQRPAAVSEEARRTAEETSDHPEPVDGDARWWMRLAWLSREAVSPLARTEHALLPWTSFVILPIFALANAGVSLSPSVLSDSITAPVAVGIFVGLVLGKPLGVLTGSIIAARTGLGRLARDVGWGDLAGMGLTAGVGFTVALFVAELAFDQGPRLDEAKVGILAASLVAGIAGYITMRLSPDPVAGVDGAAAGAGRARRRRRSVGLEAARREPLAVQLEADAGRAQQRLGRVVDVEPGELAHLLAVAHGVAAPAPEHEPDAEVVGDVTVGIGLEVVVGTADAGVPLEVGRIGLEADLLPELGHRRVGEARSLLGPAPGDRPEAVVEPAAHEHVPVVADHHHARPGPQQEVGADALPNAPQRSALEAHRSPMLAHRQGGFPQVSAVALPYTAPVARAAGRV